MDQIKKYLDECFDEYVASEELENLKEEILANASDHYADLIAQGNSHEEAMETMWKSLGDIPALLRTIGAKKRRPDEHLRGDVIRHR
jgi:hypothetical protein